MIVYIHSHDVPDAGRTFDRHSASDVMHISLEERIMPAEVGHRVERALRTRTSREDVNETIDLLILNMHGSPGRLHIGGIEDADYDVTEENAEAFSGPFASLLKRMGSDGGQGVELHGCYIAAASIDPISGEIEDSEIGYRFIYKLANGFESRVLASASPQIADSEGLFEDSLIVAEPGDDGDWHGHVTRSLDPDYVHSGGILTRARSVLDNMIHSMTSESRRDSSHVSPPERPHPSHPSWDRR